MMSPSDEKRIVAMVDSFTKTVARNCCFHTGLYTRRYKAIYACFDRNKKKDSLLEWYFRGFADELSPMLRHISPLPKKPSYYMTQYGVNYNPEWPIRVNVCRLSSKTATCAILSGQRESYYPAGH